MLHGNIFVPELLRLVFRSHQDFVQILAHINLPALHFGAFPYGLFRPVYKMFFLDFHLLYQLQNQTVLQSEKTIQEVFLLDLLISVLISQFFTFFHRLHGFLCKFLYIHDKPS